MKFSPGATRGRTRRAWKNSSPPTSGVWRIRTRGSLPAWDVDLLPQERDYRSQQLDNLLAGFRALRRETTQLLWSITDSDWSARARHNSPN